jgi:hypothetical protein
VGVKVGLGVKVGSQMTPGWQVAVAVGVAVQPTAPQLVGVAVEVEVGSQG